MRYLWSTFTFILMILGFIGCGSVTREADLNTQEPPERNYKQTRYENEWVKNINIRTFTMASTHDKEGNFYFISQDFDEKKKLFRITKLDKDTNTLWSKQYAPIPNVEYYNGNIKVDKEGFIYVAGTVSKSFIETQDRETFVMKVSAQGELLWHDKKTEPTGHEWVHDTALDSAGNFYILGDLRINKDIAKDNSTFLRKYTSAGSHAWTKIVNNTYFVEGLGIKVDKKDTIYVSGIIGRDIFVTSYKNDGEKNLYKEYKTKDSERSIHMSLSPDNHLYIAGYVLNIVSKTKELFIKKVDIHGKEIFDITFGNRPGSSQINAITNDKYGNTYVYYENNNKDKDNKLITKAFLRQYSPSGDFQHEFEYDGTPLSGSIGKENDLFVLEDESLFISGSGHIMLKGDEPSLGAYILKLSSQKK